MGQILAERLDAVFVEGDSLHSPEAVEKMSQSIPLTEDERVPWLGRIRVKMNQLRMQSKTGVVACSALSRHARRLLGADDPDVVLVYLYGTRELIADRLNQRTGHYMPPNLLDSQFDALQEPDHALRINVDQSVDAIVQQIIKAVDTYRA
ncbi:gluconokinase [Planctomycetales bacterium ZRK34]|nr:gluconokinase [Planctomycetales bacterium ZRK34]